MTETFPQQEKVNKYSVVVSCIYMGKTQVEPIGELEKRQDINFQTRLSEDIDSGIYRKDELEQESEILIRVEEEIEKYLKIIEGKFAEIAGNQFHDSLIDYNVEVIKHK